MSIYNIIQQSSQTGLKPVGYVGSTTTTINFNDGLIFTKILSGFDGYDDIPVLFSNDRFLYKSNINTSYNDLELQKNDPVQTIKNVNLIVNSDIIKARPLQPFRN